MKGETIVNWEIINNQCILKVGEDCETVIDEMWKLDKVALGEFYGAVLDKKMGTTFQRAMGFRTYTDLEMGRVFKKKETSDIALQYIIDETKGKITKNQLKESLCEAAKELKEAY